MGPVNWIAVILSAIVAVAAGLAWNRVLLRTVRADERRGAASASDLAMTVPVMLIAAAMLGHSLARIGPDTLAAKPWLYWMQSGGLAIAFVIPAVWLVGARAGLSGRARAVDAGFWLVAYLAMGTTFWALG